MTYNQRWVHYELTDKLLSKIDEDKYDLIVVNYANPDMVGHTGVMEAAVKAVEAVDTCVGKVVDKILSNRWSCNNNCWPR